MKEQLREFILKTIGGKLPDDPWADILRSCSIKLISALKLLRCTGILVAPYDENLLWVGVSYSNRVQSALLHICIGHQGCKPDFVRNIKFDEGLDLLCKLIEEDVIQIPEFNDKDKVDHQTMGNSQAEFKKLTFTARRSSGEEETITLPINKIHPWRFKGTIPKGLPIYWIFIGTYGEIDNPYPGNDKIINMVSMSVSVTREEYARVVNEINSFR